MYTCSSSTKNNTHFFHPKYTFVLVAFSNMNQHSYRLLTTTLSAQELKCSCLTKDCCMYSSLCQTLLKIYICTYILQNTPVGRSVFMVNATDPDQGTGGSVLFSFQPPSPFFAIDGARGIVVVTRALDYETTSAYQLTVNATVSKNVFMLAREKWGCFDDNKYYLLFRIRTNWGLCPGWQTWLLASLMSRTWTLFLQIFPIVPT